MRNARRRASAIDPVTRTLLVQIQVPNPTQTLFPGAYAEVHMVVPSGGAMLTVPVESLMFRKEGLQVATVVDGRVAMKPISTARDFGERIEVSHGLTADELVILNPPDSLVDGADARVSSTQPNRR